jgi:hypothetical protein
MTFHNIFYLHLLTITLCRMTITILWQLAEVASQSITLCQLINPISVMALHPS